MCCTALETRLGLILIDLTLIHFIHLYHWLNRVVAVAAVLLALNLCFSMRTPHLSAARRLKKNKSVFLLVNSHLGNQRETNRALSGQAQGCSGAILEESNCSSAHVPGPWGWLFIFFIFRENSRQQSRGKTDLGSYSSACFPGAIFKPVPFLLPPEVNTSCVSGLLTPANGFPKIIRNVFRS